MEFWSKVQTLVENLSGTLHGNLVPGPTLHKILLPVLCSTLTDVVSMIAQVVVSMIEKVVDLDIIKYC